MIEDLRLLILLYANKGRVSDYTLLNLMRGFESNKISASMLQNVTGISKHRILRETGKTVKTGGRLNPESLEDILFLATLEEFDPEVALRVMRAGTSQNLLAELTGFSQSRFSRLWREHNGSN